MKFTDILKRSLKSLLKSKLRTTLTVMAIIIGAFTLSLTTALGEGVKKAIDSQVSLVGFKNGLVITAKTDGSRNPAANEPNKYDSNKDQMTMIKYLTSEDFDKVKNTKGVSTLVKTFSVNSLYITSNNSEKYEITLGAAVDQIELSLIAGSKLNVSDKDQILIAEKYLKVLGFNSPSESINKKVSVTFKTLLGEEFSKEFTIKGVFPNSFINGGSSYISYTDAEALNQKVYKGSVMQDKYIAFIASFPDSYTTTDLTNLKSELDKQGYSAKTLEDQISIIKGVITGIQIVLGIFGAIAILVSTFGIVNTLLMSVYERVKEIGLMKALGMSSSTVFWLFSIEAGLLGFLGGLLGILVAMGVGYIGNLLFQQQKLLGFEGINILSFNPVQVLLIVAVLTVVSLIAGVFPAIKASKLDPIVALASE